MKARASRECASTAIALNLHKRLEEELERLTRILKLGYELKVLWIPNGNSKLSGEVRGDCIYIYEENEDEAKETLKHEFLDYAISKVIEPNKKLVNKLISLVNEEAYRKKEMMVERLSHAVA